MKDRRNMKDSTIKHFNPMALREKYSAGNVQRTNPFSSFWADNEWDSRRTDFLDDEPQKKGVDHVALASYRRAISNFVTIVTNQSDIPVIFNPMIIHLQMVKRLLSVLRLMKRILTLLLVWLSTKVHILNYQIFHF